MTRKLTDWLGKARRLESAISAGVDKAARHVTKSADRHPLELVHAIADAVEQEAQPSGRGQRVFPFTIVKVIFAAPTSKDRTKLEVACEGPPTLQARFVDRLVAAGCAVPALQVKVAFVPTAKDDWAQPEFHIEYARAAPAAPAPTVAPRLEIAVTHGTAAKTQYVFAAATVTLGRGSEVRDSGQRLLRTNMVAFIEGDNEVNQSVSRRHAHIAFEPATQTFRLHDDGGTHGTSVIRDGSGVVVPRGRGLRLQSGDVVVLGQARVRVKIQPDTRA